MFEQKLIPLGNWNPFYSLDILHFTNFHNKVFYDIANSLKQELRNLISGTKKEHRQTKAYPGNWNNVKNIRKQEPISVEKN